MACEDANAVIFRIKKHEHLKPEYKLELVETIKDYTPECNHYWDANDWRNGKNGSSETREGSISPIL